MIKSRRKITSFLQKIAGFFLTLLVVFSGVFKIQPAVPAFADEALAFDTTDVMADLGSTIDLSQYPAVAGADPEVYSFMEYGYSDNAFKRGNYALYLYIYNPSQVAYVELTGANVVNMAISFAKEADGTFSALDDTDGKKTLKADEYANLPLKYCGTTLGDYANLFVKFRVMGVEDVLKNVVEMEKEGFERQYSVSGFQLHEKGQDLPEDYDFGKSVYYTGYGEGLGEGAELESTLSCRWDKLETVELDVKHTFWRSETSSKGAGYQNQLDTVYFAVPKRLFDTYGTLQRIKAEWYEYLTKEIVVTSHEDFFQFAFDYIGVDTSTEKTSVGDYCMVVNYGGYGTEGHFYKCDYTWNAATGYRGENIINPLRYLFYNPEISSYDPYAEITEQGGVSDKTLYHWIKDYAALHGSEESLPIKDGSIAAELFEEDIPEERKVDNESGKIQKGYSYYDFNADLDIQEWKSWTGSDHSVWDTWREFGFRTAFKGVTEEENVSISPIYELKEEDILGYKDTAELTDIEKKTIADNLYINYNDVSALHEFYQKAIQDSDGEGTEDEEKVVVLFRFAVSDYYAETATVIEVGASLEFDDRTTGPAYVAKQSVFFNFDIIQLTFNDNGVYTVIPVVADPIDIVNPVTPPADVEDKGCLGGLRKTLAYVVIALVVLFVIWLVDKINQRRKLNVVFKAAKKNNKNNKNKKE